MRFGCRFCGLAVFPPGTDRNQTENHSSRNPLIGKLFAAGLQLPQIVIDLMEKVRARCSYSDFFVWCGITYYCLAMSPNSGLRDKVCIKVFHFEIIDSPK